MEDWTPIETNTNQDQVIAHVLGATALGYLVLDETLHLLLDIGFVWTVFVDGEMGLLPHPVAIGELETSDQARSEIQEDVDNLLAHPLHAEGLRHLMQFHVECVIKEVTFFAKDQLRRLVLTGEQANVTMEMSIQTAEIRVYEF